MKAVKDLTKAELKQKIAQLEEQVKEMTPLDIKSMDVSLISKGDSNIELKSCRGCNVNPNTGIITVEDEDGETFHLFHPSDWIQVTVKRNY